MATGHVPFNHKSVRPHPRILDQVLGECMRGDDGHESRAVHRWLVVLGQAFAEQSARTEIGGVACASDHRHGERDVLVLGQAIQHLRDFARNAGAHHHVVGPRQHGAVAGRGRGHLNLLQVVDPYQSRVPRLGQPHLHEVAEHCELVGKPSLLERESRNRGIGLAGRSPLGTKEAPQHSFSKPLDREGRQRSASCAVGIAVLKSAGQHEIKRRTGDQPQLPRAGDGGGEPPGRHRHTHTALDDAR